MKARRCTDEVLYKLRFLSYDRMAVNFIRNYSLKFKLLTLADTHRHLIELYSASAQTHSFIHSFIHSLTQLPPALRID